MSGNGEFENRDRDELGDLSEDHGMERGELARYSGRTPRVPVDMRNNAAARAAAAAAQIGSPQLDFDVRSVYDSRPVQGRDFNQWFFFSTEGGGTVPGTFFLQSFVVPTGYVAVVRRIMFRTSNANYTGPYQNEMTVLRNGAQVMPEVLPFVPFNPVDGEAAPLETIPISDGESFDLFLIADEGDTVGVRLFSSDGDPDVSDEFQYFLGFYGQFLLKTGVPAAFQIANQAGVKGKPVTVPPIPNRAGQKVLRGRDPYKSVPIVGADKMGKGRR